MSVYHINEETSCHKAEKSAMCLFQKIVSWLIIAIIVVAGFVAVWFMAVCISGHSDYGKGFMPGALLCIAFVISNVLLLRKQQNGFWLMVLLPLPIIIPTAFNEYEELIYFTNGILAFLLAYYALLRIPSNQSSYWALLNRPSTWFRNMVVATWVCFNLVMYATPFVLARNVGFTSNLFSNGQTVFNAKYGFSPSYYCNEIAQKMAHNIDIYATHEECKRWFEMSINSMSEEDYNWLDDGYYLDYAAFLESVGEYNKAYATFMKARKLFGTTETEEKLDSFVMRHMQFFPDFAHNSFP